MVFNTIMSVSAIMIFSVLPVVRCQNSFSGGRFCPPSANAKTERNRRDARAAAAQADRREKAREFRENLRKKSFTYRRISKAFPDLGLDNDEMEKKEKE